MLVHYTLQFTIVLIVMEIAVLLQNLSVPFSTLSHVFCLTSFLVPDTFISWLFFFSFLISESYSQYYGLYKCFVFQKSMYPFC